MGNCTPFKPKQFSLLSSTDPKEINLFLKSTGEKLVWPTPFVITTTGEVVQIWKQKKITIKDIKMINEKYSVWMWGNTHLSGHIFTVNKKQLNLIDIEI